MQRTNEASKPTHCATSSTVWSLTKCLPYLARKLLEEWLVSWKILYDRWLLSVWTIQHMQWPAAVYQNSSGGPEKGRSTLNLCVSETLGCGCCSTDQRMAARQTRATHHTHDTSALLSELSREHSALNYRRVSQEHTNIHGELCSITS